MKHVYAVMVGSYNQHPAIICQNEDDAYNMAIALNSLNVNAEDVEDYILKLPYMCNPDEYDVNDIVATAVSSTRKIYEDIIRNMNIAQQNAEIE